MNSGKNKLVVIYRAANGMEAQVIKSLLASYEIPCLLQSDAAPSVHVFTLDGMGEVNIMVDKALEKKARELIEDKQNA